MPLICRCFVRKCWKRTLQNISKMLWVSSCVSRVTSKLLKHRNSDLLKIPNLKMRLLFHDKLHGILFNEIQFRHSENNIILLSATLPLNLKTKWNGDWARYSFCHIGSQKSHNLWPEVAGGVISPFGFFGGIHWGIFLQMCIYL